MDKVERDAPECCPRTTVQYCDALNERLDACCCGYAYGENARSPQDVADWRHEDVTRFTPYSDEQIELAISPQCGPQTVAIGGQSEGVAQGSLKSFKCSARDDGVLEESGKRGGA